MELFAGSGVVALECLSRGADAVYLVDSEIEAAVANVEQLDAKRAFVLAADLPTALTRLPAAWPARYDFLFADPPYDHTGGESLLEAMAARLSRGGEMALEQGSPDLPERLRLSGSNRENGGGLPRELERVAQRRYGGSWLLFYRWAPEGDGGGG